MTFQMKFRTDIDTSRGFPRLLDPTKPLALVGSCFTSNMASRMKRCLWDARNPFSTLYNPASIALLLKDLISDPGVLIKESLFNSSTRPDANIISSWLLDSSFSSDSETHTLIRYHDAQLKLRDALYSGRRLIVTFGTAWVYRLKSNGMVVANCHKQPDRLFTRQRLAISEIVEIWLPLLNELESFYPGLKVIFTVSPVRHLKDGFEGNSRSKSILMLAIEEICSKSPHALYFPAYEILNDDLRDYRFYASDLVHPSDEAVEYIWEKFIDAFMDSDCRSILKEGEDICRSLAHRPNMRNRATEQMERMHSERCAARLRDFHARYPETLCPPDEKTNDIPC